MHGLMDDRRGAIYLFSVVLIAAMLVILVGSLAAIEKTTSGSILNREEELSYFQLECIKAFENKIATVMALDPSGRALAAELDATISRLNEQAAERGMWQNISYELDFQPTSLDLSPCRVSFDITTKSQGKTAYDRKEFYLSDLFVSGDELFVSNRRLQIRFRVTPGSDETRGYILGGCVYMGSDVILADSGLTDYLNISSWTNATSVYQYTVTEEPGLTTICMKNETAKLTLTKYLYVNLDEVQFQVNVEPKVSSEKAMWYGVGLSANVNGPVGDRFRIDDPAGGQLNPDLYWQNATLSGSTFKVERTNSWIVVYDDDPQPYALALILDEAEYIRFQSAGSDDCIISTPARKGRFIVNGIIRSYCSVQEAVEDMRELKKLGKPPLGRTNYLEPLILALRVKDLTFDPPAPKAGRRVGLYAFIENYGTKDAYDVVVHFYDGKPLGDRSNLLGATNLSVLLNGDTQVCSTSWTFNKPGVHEIYAVLDPDMLLAEDPTDNVKHAPLKISPQDDPNNDVAVVAVHVSSRAPSPGEMVTTIALVHNNGNRDEQNVIVRLQIIDDSGGARNISSANIANLPLGYWVSVPITFVYQSGDERARMSADPVENETDLTNNVREAYIGSTGILLVADDEAGVRDGQPGSTSLVEFLAALDDPRRYDVTVWSEAERGDPPLEVLLFFDAVAWTCGDYDGDDVETNDAATLVEFIKAGGHLVLEGEDIAYRHHQDPLLAPDNFLWNVTKSHIDGYFDPGLARIVPFDDVELDGINANTVPQISIYPSHPVMTNMPRYIPSNYTAPYPDAILAVGATALAVYESPDPAFLVLEDDLRTPMYNWPWAPSVISSPVLSGSTAFRSTGNNHFFYTFPYTVGDGVDQYRFIDLWFYFLDSDADILLQVMDGSGSWEHRWGWDVQSSYNGYSWARKGTTLNCPWGRWMHYRLDLVTDLGLAPGTQIKGLAFSSDNSDVAFDHIRLARKDSWKTSMVAYENATSGSKMVYMAYPVSVVENRTRKILIRNAIDWISGRTLNRAPLVTVTAPSGAEKWKGTQNITWSASDLDGDTLCIDLYYSQNGGITWIDLARSLENTGYWPWDTTTVPDGLYIVKAVADDSMTTGQDISASFEIDNINEPPTVTVTRPNVKMRLSGFETIAWTSSDPDGDPLTYDIEFWDGATWHTIIAGYTPPFPASPSYLWDTTSVPDGIGYLIRVTASDGANTAQDVSDQPFSIDNNNEIPTVRVIDPNGGEVWSGTKTITWEMDDLDGAGAPLGDPFRDRLSATVEYNSTDAVFNGSYSPDSSGFFRDWLLIGGYSGNRIDTDYLGGEATALPWSGKRDNGLVWWKNRDADTRIDLYSLMNPKTTVTGYGLAYVFNPVERDLKMKVGSDDGIKVYINGIMVHRNAVSRSASPDQDTVNVHLGQGWNVVLVKITQGSGAWAFYFRFTDMADQPVTDLRISLDRPNNYDTGKAYATGARLGTVVDITNLGWDTKTVPNGNYTVKVTVDDGRGGVAWDSSDSLFEIQNNRDPIVQVLLPNGKEILFGNVTVAWNATDPDGDPMTFRLYYKRGAGSWNLITTITNTSWRWYLWDISGLPDSPPEYYLKVEAYDPFGGMGWDVSDDGWYINNADGEFGGGGAGNYTGYEGPGGQIGGPGTPPGWGTGGGSGGGSGTDDPADRLSMVMLLSPLGGEEWKDTKTISWTHANFGSGLRFDVLVSLDSGSTWSTLASEITSTTYSWNTKTFPGHRDSNDYRIMIRGYDSEGNEDTDSSNNFRVYNNVKPSVTVVNPNGGEWWKGIKTITWTASDPDNDGDNDPSTPYSLKFDVYYSANSGSTWTKIASDITTTSFDWDTTTVPDGSRYRIRVVAKDGNIKGETAYDNSNADFNVNNINDPPTATITSPNGGEKLKETIPIKWTASDPDADPLTFSLYYSEDAGASWNLIQGGFTATGPSYTYNWDSTTVPDGTQYLVQVVASDGTLQATDSSNSVFTIDNTDPKVAITDPPYPPAKVVSKTITIKGTASDLGGSGLQKVEIWIRGVFEGVATLVGGNQWEFAIDTRTLPEDQTVVVEAIAYDGSGNTDSHSIQVKIDNIGN